MLTIFMIAIPCIGFFYIVLGAIFSQNTTRRNFYRAHLAWMAIVLAIYLTFFAIGYAPDIRKIYRQYQHDQALEKNKVSSDTR